MRINIGFVLVSLTIVAFSAGVSHAGGFKFVVAEDGTRNSHMTADIIGDTLAVGVHEGLGYVKIYVGAGKKWKEQAELRRSCGRRGHKQRGARIRLVCRAHRSP